MNKTSKLLLSSLLLTSAINAEEINSSENIVDNILTRTDISFTVDEENNLNPSIFVPFYYGSENQFFSGIGYTSGKSTQVDSVNNFSDSKNSLVSDSQDLLLNYISYTTSLFRLKTSVGLQSTFSKIENNEFGYIHDSNNVFGNGTDYYVSFDNSIDLDIQRHAIRADIELPIGSYFNSRLSTSISPYTQISVKQSTIFKPLSDDTGTSDSSTVQDISYNFTYEAQVKTGTFFNIGLVLGYNHQPLKYDLAHLDTDGSTYFFTSDTVDVTEVTKSYLVKILFTKQLLGGLNPSFGYGVKYLDTKNNTTGETVSTNNAVFTLGVERRF